jgi:UDP-N-acetylmuramyl pentapeptide phosphotransferase/UDP-N-acetylglucosamine-1-phosphate transferase
MDHPNQRSLHAMPTPRSGGIAILAGTVLALAVLALGGVRWEGASWLVAGVAVVVAISFADDLSHVHKGVRLLAHILAAAMVLAGGLLPGELALAALAVPVGPTLAALASAGLVVWLVNVYNFMDGMDGFAGGMAVLGFGTYAVLGAMAGDGTFAAVNACIAAAAGGFLVVNFPPARIFMGDLGSSLLGFLAGVGALAAQARGVFEAWIGLVVFSPFVVDASVTLVRRIVRGEPFWESHKSHYYQRLVELGWGHRRTVLAEYVVMILACASAVVATRVESSAQWLLLAGWGIAYTIAATVIGRAAARGGTDEADDAR